MTYPPRQATRFNELMRYKEALDLILGMNQVICNPRLFEDLRRLKAEVQNGINRITETEAVLR